MTLAALSLAACDKNDGPDTPGDGKDTPVAIASASVDDLTAGIAKTSTRAGNEGGWQDGNAFSLFYAIQDDTDTRYTASNEKWMYNGGSWKLDVNGENDVTLLLWKGDGTVADWLAVYPYQSGLTSATSSIVWSVATDQSDADMWNGKDLLIASQEGYTAKDLEINFEHALSKLTVCLTKGSEVAVDVTITEVIIGGTNTQGTMHLDGSTWDGQANVANITALGADGAYEALIVPQSLTADAWKITVKTSDAKAFTFNAPAHTFKPGFAYTLDLQVGQDIVLLGDITVTPWEDVKFENGEGDLETE